MKKIISLILSLSVVMSVMTFTAVTSNAAAIPAPQETTLFSDDFEGYTTGFSYTMDKWGKIANANLTDSFKYIAGWGGNEPTAAASGYSAKGDLTKVMQLATDAGIGSGNALAVTAQSDVLKNMLIKKSGITSDAINDKRIVFKTTFKVPSLVAFGDTVGVYLETAVASYETRSNNTNIFLTNTATKKDGELMYLGARPASTVTGASGAYASLGNGTSNNELWTFGEKVADLTAGTTYTYTVTMTPNASTGKYDVVTDLNGTKLTLSGTATSSAIPTITAMADFAAVNVVRGTHPWYFNSGNANGALATWLSTGAGKDLGITTADGLYDNNRVVAYFDDMSMKAVDIQNVVFSDDFESYGDAPEFCGSTWGNWAQYYTDQTQFKYTYGNQNDYSTNETLGRWIGAKGVKEDIATIATGSGVGSGKALKLTAQHGVTHYSLFKRTNLETADIAGRQLEFRADFKAPISGVMGEGFGVWTLADRAENAVQQMSTEQLALYKGTATDLYKGEFMYVGTRKALEGDNKVMGYGDKGARALYLYAFGEEVARLNPDATYDIKVTLTPSGTGYTAAVTLNGVTKVLAGANLPTQAEMATFKRVYVTPVNHTWIMENQGGAIGQIYNDEAQEEFMPADMIGEDGKYDMDRTIGLIDNISLIAKGTATAVTATAAGNLASVDYDTTAWGNSFLSGNAAVDGTTATVSVRSENADNVTPVIIAAAYSGDKLLGVKMNTTTTVAPFTTEEVILSGLPEGYTSVKVFLLSNLTNLIPVTTTFAQ